MSLNINLRGIYSDATLTFLYKKIESGIPFRQVALEFNKTQQQIKDVFYSKEYRLWLQNK